MTGVAVVGCGPWGRNLVRTFARLGALRAVVDVDPTAAAAAAELGGVPARTLDEVLADPSVDAVAVAVPAGAHAAVAARAIAAGRHVFVEKPLALDVGDAERLRSQAAAAGRVLMVGHLMRYHPAFVALRRLVAEGRLGRIRYLSSTRLNLGRMRREESILWSFAPHDVSMILALTGTDPVRVWATGDSYVNPGVADATLTRLEFPGGERAQVLVSWLHPFKEQRLVVGGDDAMAVLDDAEPWPTKLRLLPYGVVWRDGEPVVEREDTVPVPVEPAEPLEVECRHFLECVATGAPPETDGAEGVRVLRVLAAAAASMSAGEPPAAGRPGRAGVRVHESAYVDEPCEIGDGTAIWHFSHVLAGSRIGRDCTIGQNVMIGPRAVVGDRCKIQNNVSVYEGVTLEDGVFCGPSCVFTNVVTPRAEVDRRAELLPTRVGRGATIGANATVVCGTTLGPWSFVAAGAVVTRDVPAHALVAGVPATRIGWVSHAGERLGDDLVCPRTGRRYALAGPDRLVEAPAGDALEAPAGDAVPAAGDAVPAAGGGAPPVAMADLGAQRRRLGERIDRAFAAVLGHTRFILGPEVERLEEELAAFCGARHAVTCASGTDALLLGLLARSVGPGDAVAVPNFTFASTAEVVALLGATPLLVDVRPDTFTLDPAGLEPALAEAERRGLRPAGVIPVDLFGHPADYPGIAAAVAGRRLWVMADAAQSFGASVGGRRVGTLAPLTTTSFFPAKPLGCYGDGGALFTDDDDLADRLRSLRAHGRVGGEHRAVGANGRLDTLQAAVLLEKLAIFEDELAARRAVAERYCAALADAVAVPAVAPGVDPAWACYTVRAVERDKLAARLADDGIASATYYDRPVGAHEAYRGCPVPPGGTPVAQRLCGEVLSLPIHPYLDDGAVERVISAVRAR
ncbi:MAG TPA: aminotransferase class I/II-fold pyridoxal phosphate-dependent enzyme [Acidimicrobiales bacterium]|jgi:UDP-2-acetamido-3-amino-2,3-dideoxy-glucuronate N-acetyltransferase|nr:aminotransferase class I/II-fold pyridoxal phosphate-dependent enzyme [Acidimicrobiales bacterium]